MKRDSRLARMIHVLIHMGLLGGRETSETIAKMLNTNPVVVRRTMAALKRKGVVDSEGGRGGGWVLLRPLDDLTVLDIQKALDEGEVLAAGVSEDHPTCPVERAANAALVQAFDRAECTLLDEFAKLRLSIIAEHALSAERQVIPPQDGRDNDGKRR
ncbi:Rrf2 family transcriptional regulator (plasmid) [Ensifer adhaerens]|uniref:Rrf2 family transcriptional regulator n=1 Tax=Ensifer adhaerens TaxID=106592 RepID=UPI0023AA1159|nr:Rrf2 family transcriptional regulator [Ensifer adhaerens]WDZ79814.1 Rrf2 family transcriptional regulator [Ensifer adhaerens]